MRGKLKPFLKPTLILSLIYLVGISAILLANVHYADDVARTNYGYAGWSAFSRYSSTVLSHGIHADNYLTNVAPLPQILAAGILAISSIILILVVSGRKIFEEPWTKWILKLVAVVPLALCPYMLECLSYQYDAVYMALSVFFAVMPFIFYRQKKWQFILASMIGILGVCTTYQASIGIYPMIMIFIAMRDWNMGVQKNKEIIKNVLIAAAVFLITLIVFQKVLMTTRDVYVSNELPEISEFFPSLFSHLGHYFELLIIDFKMMWLVLIVIVIIGFIVLFTKRSKRNKFAACVFGTTGAGLMLLMCYLFYAALDKPLYTTRAMYAIGAFVAIICIYVVSGEKFRKIPEELKKKLKNKNSKAIKFASLDSEETVFTIAVLILAWCFFSFAFTYGNALKEQDTFRNMQVDMVISDLNTITNDGKIKKIQTTGQIGFAPTIEHMPEKDYFILRRLLKSSFGADVPWMAYRLTEASGLSNLVYDKDLDLTKKDLSILKDTTLYTIHGDAEGILVKFKGKEFNIWEN